MTDRQAQTMSWALQNSQWFLALRPTAQSALERTQPRDAEDRPRPRMPADRPSQIAGDFPESLNG